MNMVSLLTLGMILNFGLVAPKSGSMVVGIIASVICVAAIAWAVWQSKRETGDFEVAE